MNCRTALRMLFACLLFAPVAFAGPALAPLQGSSARADREEPRLPRAEDGSIAVDLKGEIDRAIRWLRAQQDQVGSYGDSVTDTAWVLRALARSPRAYTRDDGPFVRGALDFLAARQDPESGAIHDPKIDDALRIEQSVLALLALEMYPDATSHAVLESLKGFFQVLPNTDSKPLEKDRADVLAARLLRERGDAAHWPDDGEGSIVTTARAVIDLSRAREALVTKSSGPAANVQELPPFDEADREATNEAISRGALYLLAISEDGRWGPAGEADAGLTSMVLGALQAVPEPRPESVQKTIDEGLAWLASLQDEDGSIHDGKLKNYITSSAILALKRSGREEYAPVIAKARDYLVRLQADEGEGYSEGDRYYGGIGYGGDERPDLSNLQMALEALDAAGLESDHEAFQRAVKFLERTQNRSESNDVSIETGEGTIESGDDGGAAYMPGDSKAGYEVLPDGTKIPRSYGSMSYALLKGYLFAGLPKDDPRMQAVWNWLTDNYTLDVNPGFEASEDPDASYQGLYYYFLTMAKALDLYGQEVVTDGEGVEHQWRRELCGRLIAMQSEADGSWVNRNSPRWWEGNPTLATAYALLTLDAAKPAAASSGD